MTDSRYIVKMIDRVAVYPSTTFSHFLFAVVDSYDEDKIISDQRKCFFYYKGEEAFQYLLKLYNDEDASYLNEINSYGKE